MIKIKDFEKIITGIIWDIKLVSLPWWKAWPIRMLRVSYVVIRDLVDGQLTLRAMSLVYTTLLSLVPLLAVSFSVLKGFGVHNKVEPLLFNFLQPLGERGIELNSRIIGFVDNINVGVLGSVGLGLLIYTVVSLIQKIEGAFNYTWHISRNRPFAQRFSDYLSVIVIGPVLIFSALGITASLMSTSIIQKLLTIEPFGSLLKIATLLLPYLLIIAAFTFLYIFLPNTKVRLPSALTGAAASGILWQATGWAFASFIVASTKYTAIYSGFAILIMFMIWLYLSWLILLVGASVAFYHQQPEALKAYRRQLKLNNRFKEKLSLLVMFLICRSYYRNRPAWTMEGLAKRLHLPVEALKPILEALQNYGLLTQTGDEPPSYLPARPFDRTDLKDVLDAIRRAHEESWMDLQSLPPENAVEQLIDHIDRTMENALRGRTIKDFALSEPTSVSSISEVTKQNAVSSKHRRNI
jgi:membrane protein